jgi:glycosyltransferase involved in cell wall biosynthesis
MSADPRPVLFVTNHVPPDRVGAFAALHAREGIELALFGGRSTHATAGVDDPGVPHRFVAQADVAGLAASGAYRAVVCGTAGRRAFPASWWGARRGGVPYFLWSALWAPVRSAAGLSGQPLMRHVVRTAAAVITYGPHVSAYAERLGARRTFVAPQAVDADFWGAPGDPSGRVAPFVATFLGREDRAKGAWVAEEAWRASGLLGSRAAFVVCGAGADPPRSGTAGAVFRTGPLQPSGVRDVLTSSDVLLVPSLRTRTFREPWGLVVNEAFHQGVPVIASDEVGAVAGGLVRDGRNGLVVPAGDVPATAAALRRLHDDSDLRARLGRNAREDVAPYTYAAWAEGFSRGLSTASTARNPC